MLVATSKPDDRTPQEWVDYLDRIRRPDESRLDGIQHGMNNGCWQYRAGGVRIDNGNVIGVY